MAAVGSGDPRPPQRNMDLLPALPLAIAIVWLGAAASPNDVALAGLAASQKKGIQLLEGVDPRQGHQKVAAAEAHQVLHQPLLTGSFLARSVEVAFEQIVGAGGDELPLLLPPIALKDQLHCRGQVVVGDAPGHSPDEAEGGNMVGEESLSPLRGEGERDEIPRSAVPRRQSRNQGVFNGRRLWTSCSKSGRAARKSKTRW